MEPERNEDDSQRKFGYIEILWHIENYFPATCKKTWIIHSPEFSVEGHHLTKWRLSLRTTKTDEDSNYVTSIYLERLVSDSFRCAVQVQWNLWYTYGDESKMICVKECVFEEKGTFPVKIRNLKGLESLLQMRSSRNVSIGGLILVRSTEDISILKRAKDLGLKSLSQDLGALYQLRNALPPPNTEYFDVTVAINGNDLMCHKAVLCARSETLQDAIEGDEDIGLVYLDWDNYESVVKVFSYLYSGNLDYVLRIPSILIDKCIQYLKIKVLETCYPKDTITLRTKFDAREISVKWLVRDIESINGHPFTSCLFCKGSLNFRLCLFQNGTYGNKSDHMSIFLEFVDGTQPEETYVEFAILDIFGHLGNKKAMRWSFEEGGKLAIEDFVSREILNSSFYIYEGCLCLICTLYIPTGSSSLSVVKSQTCSLSNINYEDHYALFSTHIESLLLTGKHSDLTLVCGNESFRVHKCILSARSLWFRDKVKGLREGKVLRVSVVDSNTMRIVLGYIYSGKLKDHELCDILKIYRAAGFFSISALKYECSTILRDNLRLSNVVEVLCPANTYKDFRLKTSAFKFIMDNITDVQKQDGWKQFRSENGSLYEEMKKYVVNYAKSNPEEAFKLVHFQSEWFRS